MESKTLEEKQRYLNYLIILNGNIRKIYLVDKYANFDAEFRPTDKITTFNELIKSEIEQISPDLDLIANKDNNLLFVVNTKKILPEDIVFLQNISDSLPERIEKNEDAKLGKLLGYMCPLTPVDTPLRMTIVYTAKINTGEIMPLFKFVCVLTKQNFEASKALLHNIKQILLSNGIIVNMLIQGPNRTINYTDLKTSALPDETPASTSDLKIPIDRQLNYLIVINSNIRKAYFLGLGNDIPNTEKNMQRINLVNEKIRQEIAEISPDLELILNKDNRFIFVVNKQKILPSEINFLQNITTFDLKNMDPSENDELGRLLGYQCKLIPGKRLKNQSGIKYDVKINYKITNLFSFACELTKSKFELCKQLLEDIKRSLPDHEILLNISNNKSFDKDINSTEINIDSLPDDETVGGKRKNKKSKKKKVKIKKYKSKKVKSKKSKKL